MPATKAATINADILALFSHKKEIKPIATTKNIKSALRMVFVVFFELFLILLLPAIIPHSFFSH